jgi:hypothetical protein
VQNVTKTNKKRPDPFCPRCAPLEYIWNQGRAAGAPFGLLPQYTPTGNTTPHDLSRKFPHNLFPKRTR